MALGFGRERGGPLEGAGGDVVGAPLAGTCPCLLECRRRRCICANDCEGEVPRPPIVIGVRERIGEGTVRRFPLCGRGSGIDRRPRERMTPFHPVPSNADEAVHSYPAPRSSKSTPRAEAERASSVRSLGITGSDQHK